LLAFLERNRDEDIIEYPFSGLFPRNSCESVSLILAYLLEEKYGLDNVRVIKGTKRSHEHHFWVRAGDLLYDLTAHQFGRRKPIIGALASPFHMSYPDWEVESGREFVKREPIIRAYREGIIPF
jgi:hypothetical protein